MVRKELKKLMNEKTPKEIISLYIHNRLYLTDKQLTELIILKNKKER